MNRKKLNKLIFCCLFWSTATVAQVVIVNPHNLVSELSRDNLRAIFAMRTPVWPDNTAVHVYVLYDNHPLHVAFCKDKLGMLPYQLRRIWDRQVFSGTGIAPITVKSEQEMLEHIAHDKGAIGYLSSDSIPPSIKVIKEKL